MSYFISKDDLDKAIDAVFTAIAKMFTDKDKEINRKLKELETKLSLLINTVGIIESNPKGDKKISENEETKD